MKQAFRKNIRLAMVVAFALTVAALPALLHARPAAPGVVGNWQGALNAGGQSLRIVLHFTQAKDDSLSGSLESPDQGPGTIAMDKIDFKDPTLHFEITSIGGIYDGSVNKDKSEITGHWKQGGQDFELNLKRAQ